MHVFFFVSFYLMSEWDMAYFRVFAYILFIPSVLHSSHPYTLLSITSSIIHLRIATNTYQHANTDAREKRERLEKKTERDAYFDCESWAFFNFIFIFIMQYVTYQFIFCFVFDSILFHNFFCLLFILFYHVLFTFSMGFALFCILRWFFHFHFHWFFFYFWVSFICSSFKRKFFIVSSSFQLFYI